MNEHALKERLKVIAIEKITTPNKVWKQLLLERFLARLANSAYQEKFIFKGGLLLAQYIEIKRETIDIDLLMTKIKSELPNIESSIKEICLINLEDGFSFGGISIAQLDQSHMEYNGYRVTLDVKFSNMRDKIQIDIGVGDVINPIRLAFTPFEYKGKPIFAGEISLQVYSPESIFAEKLETIISKGAINSRMKDYHDIIMMIREPDLLNIHMVSAAVNNTFANRGTERSYSLKFDDDAINNMQRLWTLHLQRLGEFKKTLNLPEHINNVIDEINNWILKIEKDL